ncbi:MAG: hypothetical protein LCH41_05125 [Armatimonadetes bacterium]|nr:hypothetical protein [Armatimonadota bacterium]
MVRWKGIVLGLMLIVAALGRAEVRKASEPLLDDARRQALESSAKRLGTPESIAAADSVFLTIMTNGAMIEVFAMAPRSLPREPLARAIDGWAKEQGFDGETRWDDDAVLFRHTDQKPGAASTQKSIDLEALRIALGDQTPSAIGRLSVHRAADHNLARKPDFVSRGASFWLLPRGQSWGAVEAGFTLPFYAIPLLTFAALWLIAGPLLILAFGTLRDHRSTKTLSDRASDYERLIKHLPAWCIGLHAPVFGLLVLDNTLQRVLILWIGGSLASRAWPLILGGVAMMICVTVVLGRRADKLRGQMAEADDSLAGTVNSLGIHDYERRRNPSPWKSRLVHIPPVAASLVYGFLSPGTPMGSVALVAGGLGAMYVFFYPGWTYHWKFGLEEGARLELDMQALVDREAADLGVEAPEAKIESRVEWTARYAELVTDPASGREEFRFGILFDKPLSEGEKRFLVHRELCQKRETASSRRAELGGYLWLIPAIAIPLALFLIPAAFPSFRFPLGTVMLVAVLTLSMVPRLQNYLRQQVVIRADQAAIGSFDSPDDARAFFANGLAEELLPSALTVPNHARFEPRVAALKKVGLL